MIKEDWKLIKHFGPHENWGDWRKMSFFVVSELDHLREYMNRKIIIHRGYDPKNPESRHSHGDAIDCHAEGITLLEFYLAAARFNFKGIGVYPKWNNPGLHLDKRPAYIRSQWGMVGGVYVKFDNDFMKDYLIA